jgi:predicted CXXCH cytochrome family protein
VIGVGKLPNHIPADPLLDCDACHDTINFAAAVFDHASTNTSDCLSCHDGNISIGKTFNHVSTSLNCSSCHNVNSSFSTFAGTFVHDLNIVGGDCASCHNTGIATPKKLNHIPAQAECSQCHNDMNTGGFTLSTFMSNVHSGITSGCEGCHNGRFSTISGSLYGKSGNHLPTGQDCDVCHTNASFAAPTIFAHAGITGNCTSCHDGNYSFAGALGKVDDPTPPHPATTSDCGSCHAIGNNFTDGTFDHTGIVSNCASCHGDNPTATPEGPRKNSGHIPTTQDCSFCHVPGTFKPSVFDHTGIVDNCASCHGDNASAAVTKKSIDHVSTTRDCSVCHNTTAFAGARFDHTGIVNNCSSCHDGATARGKTPPPDHVPTTQDCNVCHQTTGFIPGSFDHVGIVDNCSSCHNDVFAIGKASASNHVLTNQDCGVCHNTRTFVGAVFDHTGIVDNCASCHDGSTAIGMDAKTNPAHIATALDCHSCHTTATFVGGTWTHDDSSTGNCDQCHSPGGGARSKPSGHLSTNVQCDACHSTNGWAPSTFRHDPNGDYPGDHRRTLACSSCHGNTIENTFNWRFDQYKPFCAACHANDFESESDHIGGRNGTVEQNKNCGQSGCHRITSSEF